MTAFLLTAITKTVAVLRFLRALVLRGLHWSFAEQHGHLRPSYPAIVVSHVEHLRYVRYISTYSAGVMVPTTPAWRTLRQYLSHIPKHLFGITCFLPSRFCAGRNTGCRWASRSGIVLALPQAAHFDGSSTAIAFSNASMVFCLSIGSMSCDFSIPLDMARSLLARRKRSVIFWPPWLSVFLRRGQVKDGHQRELFGETHPSRRHHVDRCLSPAYGARIASARTLPYPRFHGARLPGSYAAAFMSDTSYPFAAPVIFVPFLHDRQPDPRLLTQPLGTSAQHSTRYALATSSFLCGDGHACLHDTHCLRMHPHRHGDDFMDAEHVLVFRHRVQQGRLSVFWSSRFLLW